MNINDNTLHKVYKTDEKTKIKYKKGTQVKFENIINVSNNSDYTSFTIIFNTDKDITNLKKYFPDTPPTSVNGGRIRSRNNRKQNKTTKYKRNRSIRNKKYYRISRRK